MRILTADIIFPVSGPPLKNALLYLDDDDRVIKLGKSSTANEKIESYHGILCPGFVNVHCHLELSWLKGQIAPFWGLDQFIRDLVEIRKSPVSDKEKDDAMNRAVSEMYSNGIVAAADIMNTRESVKVKHKGPIRWHSFVEALGSDPESAGQSFINAKTLYEETAAVLGRENVSMTAHSTYSVSSELLGKISEYCETTHSLFSIHHQENEDENLYFLKRKGKIIRRLQDFRLDYDHAFPVGARPLPILLPHLPVSQRIILVHNTVSTEEDVTFAEGHLKDPWWCFCPNANLFIEHRLPDMRIFQPFRDHIVLGTDGLASNNSLSVFDEMKTLMAHFSYLQLGDLLRWACLNGAVCLNMDDWAGSFDPGKKPGVNLIERVDLEKLKLTSHSTVRNLTSHPSG